MVRTAASYFCAAVSLHLGLLMSAKRHTLIRRPCTSHLCTLWLNQWLTWHAMSKGILLNVEGQLAMLLLSNERLLCSQVAFVMIQGNKTDCSNNCSLHPAL
jgi:hypothetical protein